MEDTDRGKIIEQLGGKEGDFPPAAVASPEQGDRWKQLDGIARMMQEEPEAAPPAGLGERIMGRLRTHRPSPWEAFKEILLKPHSVSFHPMRALRSPITGQECSFYFIMAGVFYAVLGMILMVGLHKLGSSMASLGLVRWQPLIAIATAICLVAMGFSLLKDSRLALRVARIGALIYLGFAFLNGMIVPLEWDFPVSAFVSMLSSLVGIPTGFFLFRAIQNCGKRYA